MTSKWLAPAVDALKSCEALYITAGAGMSADSGLSTFRSKEGFWNAYPPAKKAGLSFSQVSNPASFDRDERLAWGFFGHRYQLYTNAEPHHGYHILHEWSQNLGKCFVFTSNVDGMFERSGFSPDAICECHGSIHHIQARHPQTDGIMIVPASESSLPLMQVDSSFNAVGELPVIYSTKQKAHVPARPNIMMFGDPYFVEDRTEDQYSKKDAFFRQLPKSTKLVIIEIGAGEAVPTVRYESEKTLARFPNASLLRINVEEPQGPERTIQIPETGLKALAQLNTTLEW